MSGLVVEDWLLKISMYRCTFDVIRYTLSAQTLCGSFPTGGAGPKDSFGGGVSPSYKPNNPTKIVRPKKILDSNKQSGHPEL